MRNLYLFTLLKLERLAHDILAHVVVFGQVEELADLASTLGTTSTRDNAVGETVDLLLALLDNHERQDAQILVDYAALDRLAASLATAALTVARHAACHQQANTVVG